MKTLKELKEAIRNNKKLVFKNGSEIVDIEYIEEITKEFDTDTPILVTYNGGEAEIYLQEMYFKSEIEDFLKSIEIDNVNIIDFVNVNEIDTNTPAESIFDLINDNGGFDVEIIYYTNAIEYLKRYDSSLSESLQFAIEYGYTIEDINSELLASLLASKNAMCNYWDYQNEIDEFFNNL
jgi:hypothetical protein